MGTANASFRAPSAPLEPVVSVIVPTYNRAKYLGLALGSVLEQSYRNFELIVVDDGSSDETAEVVATFHDPRLIYIRQENLGRSIARNRALTVARGRYIAFLDSDDEYLPDKLSQQVQYLDNYPEVGMVYTSALCINDKGDVQREYVYTASHEGDIYRQIAFFRPLTITLPTVMLRREVLEQVGAFDEKMERFEDTDLWRRIAKRFRVGVIRDPTCRLRTHHSNALASQDPDKIVAAINYYLDKVFREDADIEQRFLKRGASGLLEYYGRAFIGVRGWRKRGAFLLYRAFLLWPMRIFPIALLAMVGVIKSIGR
mgnify:CR=1 FL=1